MLNKPDKNALREVRHLRVRQKVAGTSERPRLNVYRSLNEIYAQIIDDEKGHTLVSASTMSKDLKDQLNEKTKMEAAKMVGLDIARKAKEAGIESVVFDRGGYLYTGRVAEVAKGAREGGLNF
jgi:large subunit ribosomal protein L18